MGKIDAEGKRYLSANRYFSDLFNYILYKGEQVIQPERLREMDSSQVIVPYGNGVRISEQKYRDLIKLWSVKTDGNAVYMLLGVEIQNKTHYAMPVRNALYDMIGYAKQIEQAGRSYRGKKKQDQTV